MRRFKLTLTCPACPEQYDVHFEGKIVGYLRLRHGCFTADYIPSEGTYVAVYNAAPIGDGLFEDDERVGYLNNACRAIDAAMDGRFDVEEMEPIYDLNEPEP